MLKIQKIKSTKVVLGLLGLISLIWFLVRVIPKPQRAGYPCQQTAFPLASGFVLWIMGLIGGNFFYRKSKFYFQKSNVLLVLLFLIFSAVSYSLITISFNSAGFASTEETTSVFVPTDSPNSPIGTAKGIFPGRVVWNYNPNATNYNPNAESVDIDATSGATQPVVEGNWYVEGNIVQSEVDKMISETICKLTETLTDKDAWHSIFKFFNKNHQKGDIGYSSGEKIAIKINLNNSGNHGEMNGASNISPQMVLGLLKQLVNVAGVPEANITFYDVSRQIPSSIYDLCKNKFPDVNFVDQAGGDGRIKGKKDINKQINWSEQLVLEPLANPANPAYLPTCVTEAEYLINFSNLKAHSLAGISLCAKNFFGSFISPNTSDLQPPQSAGIHPYIAVRNSDGYTMRSAKTYNVLVDLLGCNQLGGKTLLYMVDALYAVPSQGAIIAESCKWKSAPFNGNWTSSLFASFDVIALESVCLDFLRTEQSMSTSMRNVSGNVDNYLHEAALANAAPSGAKYTPNLIDPLKSIGVHEHWNNADDKKYSRNLGSGNGIELIDISREWVPNSIRYQFSNTRNNGLTVFPNPATDIINLHLESPVSGKGVLVVCNSLGVIIYKELITKTNQKYSNSINIKQFKGILFVKIEIGKLSFMKTISRKE